MNRQESFVLGIVLGAGLMYLLDPERGRRRRALIRDQVVHGAHEIDDLRQGFASRARHIRNRARGVLVETRTRLVPQEVDDPVLEGRVRAALGRMVTDPSAIQVSAEHGRVTLRGVAPQSEVDTIADQVQEVPGVHDVINRMESRETAG
jgi:osmotically-inducible protein OsmY